MFRRWTIDRARQSRASVLLRPIAVIGSALLFSIAAHADAPADPTRMERLRAAYLFSFTKLVKWPSSTETKPFTFCFVGARGVRDALVSGTAGRTLGIRPIATRTISATASQDGCQVLYVESSALDRVLAPNPGASVLTVGDAERFTQQGGILALFEDHSDLRFDVNLSNARLAGISIGPELIAAAAHVDGAGK